MRGGVFRHGEIAMAPEELPAKLEQTMGLGQEFVAAFGHPAMADTFLAVGRRAQEEPGVMKRAG